MCICKTSLLLQACRVQFLVKKQMQAVRAHLQKCRAKRAAKRDLLQQLQWWTVEALKNLKPSAKHQLPVQQSLQQKVAVFADGCSYQCHTRLHGGGGGGVDDEDDDVESVEMLPPLPPPMQTTSPSSPSLAVQQLPLQPTPLSPAEVQSSPASQQVLAHQVPAWTR